MRFVPYRWLPTPMGLSTADLETCFEAQGIDFGASSELPRAQIPYYDALSTGRPIDGQTSPNPIKLWGEGRFARR